MDNAIEQYKVLSQRLNRYADSNAFFMQMQREFKQETGKHINEHRFWKLFDDLKKTCNKSNNNK